ncbi:hypothetical protein [Hymenobacter metallicola]|uniref:Uncharacterized protein n=1 Tax=Hymenobacter metallicola TaxID=2563114 RepID=A0A4Z0QE79_9BACT|nr:hypothetical protein [Hymenobacter metallicola]TGE28025.1 hypothetical protein E5K02_00745 [Hymenobacter metallicola]
MGKYLFLPFAFLLTSCQQEKPAQSGPETVVAVPPPVANDDQVLAYIDSLQLAVTQHQSRAALLKLDSMACISDGYITEAVDAAAATIWDQQFTLLLDYLYQHPKSLLRPQLIWGLSARLCTEEDRAQALARFTETSLDSARRTGLSSAEMVFLQQILSEVNPALLD